MFVLLDYVSTFRLCLVRAWLPLYLWTLFGDYIRLCYVSTFIRTILALLDRIVGTYFVYNLDLDNVIIFDLGFMLFINLDLD